MKVFKLIFKNTLRHKLRTALTILAISIAVMAFGLLRTVVTAWYAGVEASAANRLISRQAVSFIFPLPYSYRDQIAKLPGCEDVNAGLVWQILEESGKFCSEVLAPLNQSGDAQGSRWKQRSSPAP